MKASIILAACLLLIIAASLWLVLSFRAKLKYDRVKTDLASSAYAVIPFDQKTKAFLNNVEATWTRGTDETNGPSSEVVTQAGLTPSVSNLVYTFNYQMPAYRWLSPAQNRKAAVFGLLKAEFFPVSVDKVWHMADDGHLAMLWCRSNAVYVYRDEANGMRETLFYQKKKGVDPDGATNGSKLINAK
jgi:hypothetical protein